MTPRVTPLERAKERKMHLACVYELCSQHERRAQPPTAASHATSSLLSIAHPSDETDTRTYSPSRSYNNGLQLKPSWHRHP